jgi:methylthioribose-1-phosphate isomerase
VRIAPEGIDALHPAFDVTPARLVTAIVTERGVVQAPYGPALAALAAG